MWDWLRRRLTESRHSSAQVAAAREMGFPANQYWGHMSGRSLNQGDLLPGCYVPIFQPDFHARPSMEEDVALAQADLIIVTQSCDLENEKAPFVAMCPIWGLDVFSKLNPKFARNSEREEIRKGRREGLHMLASPEEPSNNQRALVVDFRQIYSLPVGYLRGHATAIDNRWRLQSPFLEHFSQAFARFFMRVGLPSAVPQFK